jgi:hypothetical protein
VGREGKKVGIGKKRRRKGRIGYEEKNEGG